MFERLLIVNGKSFEAFSEFVCERTGLTKKQCSYVHSHWRVHAASRAGPKEHHGLLLQGTYICPLASLLLRAGQDLLCKS